MSKAPAPHRAAARGREDRPFKAISDMIILPFRFHKGKGMVGCKVSKPPVSGVAKESCACSLLVINRKNSSTGGVGLTIARLAALLLALIAVAPGARAEEARTIRIAQQYGIPFLPLTVM